ncbi:MAG: PTS sugar transporter subunit IIA [Sphaerochaetaceae bacterium]
MNFHTDLESVVCHITCDSKQQAINEVIDECAVFTCLADIKQFKAAVMTRELLESTGIGHGIAIAHGKVPGLNRVIIGLGLSVDGISYDAADNEPVHFLFVIASSPTRQLEYIRTLSTLLRSVSSPQVRSELLLLDKRLQDTKHMSPQSDTLLQMLVDQHFSWLWHPTH